MPPAAGTGTTAPVARTGGTASGEWMHGMPRVTGGYVPPKRVQGEFYTYQYPDSAPRPTSWAGNPFFADLASKGLPWYTPNPTLKGVEIDPFKTLPFEDRIPIEAHRLVLDVYDEIGVYGGTWRMGASGWMADVAQFSRGGCVVRYPDQTYWPYMCEGWVQSDDGRENTFTLRQGMKWADGEPMVMENVRFAFEDIQFNDEFKAAFHTKYRDPIDGEFADFVIVDDWTFQLNFRNPFYNFIEGGDRFRGPRCRVGCWYGHPMVKQYHEKFADPTKLAALIAGADVETWVDLLKMQTTAHGSGLRDVPHIGPLMQTAGLSVNVGTKYHANPYHPVFDPDGNQLPYYEQINVIPYESREVAVFRAMAGEHDLGDPFLFNVQELPLYQANMEKGDYSLYMWTLGNTGGRIGQQFNHFYNENPEIARMMREKDFHHAWSLAIDGEAINDTVVLGLGIAQGAMVFSGNAMYPGDGWDKYSGYDPVAAGKILDGMGYVDTDGDGIRNYKGDLTGDTGNIELYMEIGAAGSASGDRQAVQTALMVENLSAIGIKLDYLSSDQASANLREGDTYLSGGSPQFLANYWQSECIGLGHHCAHQGAIGQWYASDGAEGMGPTGPDPAYLPLAPIGAFPIDPQGTWVQQVERFIEGFGFHLQDPRRIAIGKKINSTAAEAYYGIGFVEGGPTGRWTINIKRNNLRNVPKDHSNATIGLRNETYYFELGLDNQNNPGNRSKSYKSESFLTGLSYD